MLLEDDMSKRVKSNLYWVYGLEIASEIRLRDLLPSTAPSADVEIRYDEISDSVIADLLADAEVFEKPGCRILTTANAMCVHWDRVGKFLVHAGSQVLVDPEPNVLEDDLQPFLIGPILAVLLHQRGSFVLHSSAVVIDDAVMVFLGSKGDGKSTLAAHLQVRGHQLISDDLVPVSFDRDSVLTYPGFPRIKLFEDAILAVGEQPERFPLVHRFVEKRSFRHTEQFPMKPLEIRGVYILSDNETVSLEAVAPAAAFIELTKHSFLNRFLNAMKNQQEHFEQCQKVVRSVPVQKLNRPREFAVMNQVCSLLEDDAQKLRAVHPQ